ncbi:MAG TPA: BTAD domain-containing putative transcriptional regulator [Acidimicrobiales bacterium]|nr:BTAD domain-containing putative transcriptional regulator [Acidimicrobiales bacterium]
MRPPRVRALPRERLLRSLAGAIDHRLLLVTGPAGCGKTTLLAQFVTTAPDPSAWYQLDAGDGRETTMLAHLAQALASVLPHLDGVDGWHSADEAAEALDALPAGALATGKVVLALDDLHAVAGSPGEAALGTVVELAPPWLAFAATCRQPPAWNLPRLRVSGALYEVGPDDLRFRSWEVERLFADVYGEPLPPGDLARLAHGLEGWAAGLQLFHLATRGKHASERRRAVAALPARSKLIRDYLSGNVLDELPAEQRTFLVDTSVLGRLTPALCDELRQVGDSRRLLAELEDRQVFVTRLDEDEPAFRYHEVFRGYLETRLVERDGEEQAKEWSRRAAGLMEAAGCLVDALRAFCWSGDWAAVERIVATGGAELADDSGAWLDLLPAGLAEDDPWLTIAAARRAVATGRFATALALYERVERLQVSDARRDICRRERAVVAAWLEPGAPVPPGWAGRLRAVVRSRPLRAVDERRAVPRLAAGGSIVAGPVGEAAAGTADTAAGPGREPVSDPVGGALVEAVALALGGRLGESGQRLVALADDPDVALPAAAAARVTLTAVNALAGRPVAGELDDLAEVVELADMPWLSAVAPAAAGLGGGEGRARAVEVAAERDAQGDPWGSVAARFFAVLGSLVTGGSPVDDLVDLCDRLHRLDAGAVEAWCRAWLATALARSGDARALEVARTAESTAATAGVPGAEMWAITVQAQLGEGHEAAGHEARAADLRRRWQLDVPVPPLDGDRAADQASPAVPQRPAAARGPGLRVRCLGGFRLELDGRVVDVAAVKPRARAALHLLAAHGGRPVHAETLVDALWPDLDMAAGKRNLQVAVSSLRRLFDDHNSGGSRLVRREGPAYVLALPDVGCADVAVFTAARDEARDAARAGDGAHVLDAGDRALVAYGGDLLPEEGPAEWVVGLRRQLAADAADVALLVGETAATLGSRDIAAAAFGRGLDIDRYHDGLWRALIDAQERSGDLAAATRTLDRYNDVLRELGLDTVPAAVVAVTAPVSDEALA